MWVMASDFPAWCWAGSIKIDTRASQFYVTFRLSIFFHYLCLVLLFYSVLGDSSLNRMPSQATTDCNKREIQVTTSLTGLGEETYACKPSNLVKWDSLCIQILDFFFLLLLLLFPPQKAGENCISFRCRHFTTCRSIFPQKMIIFFTDHSVGYEIIFLFVHPAPVLVLQEYSLYSWLTPF